MPGSPGLSSGGRGAPTPLSVLERARSNDPGAWDRLVGLYRPLVEFWCRRAGLASGDVEDVAQDVLAAAARGLGEFRRDRPGDTFRGWLRGIARNQALMHFRRNRGRPRAEGGSEALHLLQEQPSPPDPSDADEPGESAEVGQLYFRALEQVRSGFEDRTWRAFWLSAVEGRARPTSRVNWACPRRRSARPSRASSAGSRPSWASCSGRGGHSRLSHAGNLLMGPVPYRWPGATARTSRGGLPGA